MPMLVFLLFFGYLQCAVRAQVYELETIYPMGREVRVPTSIVFKFTLATPKQEFQGLLSPVFKDLIVVDSECGKPQGRCPRYCWSKDFSHFCDPLCLATKQSRQFICDAPNRVFIYNASTSSTYRPIAEESKSKWTRRVANKRPLLGKRARETFTLKDIKSGRQLIATDFDFVQGLSMDSRLYFGTNVIFGMAPGKDALINKLHSRGLIDAPLLSVTLSADRLLIGGMNREKCTPDWHHYPLADAKSWTVEAQAIRMANFDGEFKQVKVLSDPEWATISIPHHLIDDLQRRGLLGDSFKEMFYAVDCSTNLTMEFQFHDRSFVIPSADIVSDEIGGGVCVAYISPVKASRYSEDPEWKLGTVFLKRFCHVYNFAENTLGLADSRKAD